jgi:hypothetical protein
VAVLELCWVSNTGGREGELWLYWGCVGLAIQGVERVNCGCTGVVLG